MWPEVWHWERGGRHCGYGQRVSRSRQTRKEWNLFWNNAHIYVFKSSGLEQNCMNFLFWHVFLGVGIPGPVQCSATSVATLSWFFDFCGDTWCSPSLEAECLDSVNFLTLRQQLLKRVKSLGMPLALHWDLTLRGTVLILLKYQKGPHWLSKNEA